jgi:hypothetical protein
LPIDVARRLAHRLDLGAAAEQGWRSWWATPGCSAPRHAGRRARRGAVFPVVIHLERGRGVRYLLTRSRSGSSHRGIASASTSCSNSCST